MNYQQKKIYSVIVSPLGESPVIQVATHTIIAENAGEAIIETIKKSVKTEFTSYTAQRAGNMSNEYIVRKDGKPIALFTLNMLGAITVEDGVDSQWKNSQT